MPVSHRVACNGVCHMVTTGPTVIFSLVLLAKTNKSTSLQVISNNRQNFTTLWIRDLSEFCCFVAVTWPFPCVPNYILYNNFGCFPLTTCKSFNLLIYCQYVPQTGNDVISWKFNSSFLLSFSPVVDPSFHLPNCGRRNKMPQIEQFISVDKIKFSINTDPLYPKV